MSNADREDFDFAAYKSAFTDQNVEAWADFYADNAEWIEYRPDAPPHAPHRMIGKQAIVNFLNEVKAGKMQLTITDDVIGSNRAAFCVTSILPDGRQAIENMIVDFTDGKITRQVEVEVWD